MTSADITFSRKQPAWHVLVLGILTLLFYLPFWTYKTIKILRGQDLLQNVILKKLPPSLVSIAMVIPFVNVLVAASVFYESLHLFPESASPLKKNVGLSSLVLALFMCSLWPLSKGEGPQVLLFTLGALPCALCQHWLNAYWDTAEVSSEELVYREAFSVPELIVLIISSLIFGLIVFNFMIEKVS